MNLRSFLSMFVFLQCVGPSLGSAEDFRLSCLGPLGIDQTVRNGVIQLTADRLLVATPASTFTVTGDNAQVDSKRWRGSISELLRTPEGSLIVSSQGIARLDNNGKSTQLFSVDELSPLPDDDSRSQVTTSDGAYLLKNGTVLAQIDERTILFRLADRKILDLGYVQNAYEYYLYTFKPGELDVFAVKDRDKYRIVDVEKMLVFDLPPSTLLVSTSIVDSYVMVQYLDSADSPNLAIYDRNSKTVEYLPAPSIVFNPMFGFMDNDRIFYAPIESTVTSLNVISLTSKEISIEPGYYGLIVFRHANLTPLAG